MTDNISLKSCPFCGGKAFLVRRKNSFIVGCSDCTASVEDAPGTKDHGKVIALDRWNQRSDTEDMRLKAAEALASKLAFALDAARRRLSGKLPDTTDEFLLKLLNDAL